MILRTIASALVGVAAAGAALAQSDGEASSSGTGFFVNGQGWAVTNAHVLNGCTRASVPGIGDAVDWALDKQNDLAVVRVMNGRHTPHLSLRGSKVRLGEEIAAYGFPLRGFLSESIKVTTGNVSSLVGVDDDTRYLQISTPLQPGNSGGPVVDHAGAVVGVATATLGSTFAARTGVLPQNVNFAIRSSVLEMFLQSRNIDYDLAEPTGDTLKTAELSEQVVPATIPILCYGGKKEETSAEASPPSTLPAVGSNASFRSLDDHDVIGFDYHTIKNVSQAQCQQACSMDRGCRALTYNKKERFCFLKSGAALIVRNPDAFTSVAESVAADVAVSTFVIRSGRDMAGGDYKRLRNSNFVGCYLACESDDMCRAFAYVTKNRDCWLKDRIRNITARRGVELGVR